MDYIDIPNVKIAWYYWLKFNMSNGMDTYVDGLESTVTFVDIDKPT